MDFATSSRARGAKYGKNKNRTQLHNFYDVQASVPTTVSSSKRFPISPSSAGTPQQDRDATVVSIDSPSPSPVRSVRPAHVTSHSRSPVSSSHDSRSTSPKKRDSDAAISAYDMLVSTYDLISSDEDDDLEVLERRPIKKPKMSPPEQQKKPGPVKLVSSQREMDQNTERGALKKKERNIVPSQPQETEKKGKKTNLAARNVRRDANAQFAKTMPNISDVNVPPEPVLQKAVQSKKPKDAIQDDSQIESEAAPSQPAVRKSRTKLKPRTLDFITPKKLQQPVDSSDTSGASPSQLGINHLRLSNETSPEPDAIALSPRPTTSVSVLPRGRKRLIDRLDTAASQPTPRAKVAASNFEEEIERLQKGTEPEMPPPISQIPKLSRTGSSQTRQTYRSRNTYAKERSHLSDMVDDLDGMSQTSSQGGSQQLLSGLLNSGPSQLQSQLEIESDSSEDAPTFRLKSIHELKQAGSNNRLEKEVEDLMVDINPTSSTKALRIQAFMQIMRKMSQEGFASFLLGHAVDRLSAWSSSMKDKTSKLLLGMILWRLIHCSAIAPPSLKQIIQCVVANSSSLPPLDTIAQIAKSRTENLSKSAIRGLVDFEQTILLEGMLPAYEGEGVIPAAITLGVLNDSIRKMVDAGTIIPLPQSSYTQIVALLQQVSQPSADQVVKHAFVTKLALSLLQICAGPLEQDLGLSQSEYRGLGDTLGDVIHRSLDSHEDLVQSILHFSITLCNDRPNICEAMCTSALSTSLMAIIESRFTTLVNAAHDSQEVQPTMLDSIILSLACLLNLTEHADEVRRDFAISKVTSDKTGTNLSLLVHIYIDTAPRLEAVKTVEQGSALVMVGYLSLLICNLCLDEQLWQSVSDQLTQTGEYSISDIVASAKTLLIHLRTVEDATVDTEMGGANSQEKATASLDNFTMRFGEILSAVRIE